MDKPWMMMILTSLLLSPLNAAAASDPNECTTKITSWYTGDSLDETTNTWQDASGHGNDASITNTHKALETDESNVFYLNNEPVVYGYDEGGIVEFQPHLTWDYTLFHLCKYFENVDGRIIQADEADFISGFHFGNGGVAHDTRYLTDGSEGNLDGHEWILSSQTHYLYRGNGVDYTIPGVSVDTTSVGNLWINGGTHPDEVSDWVCAEVIIADQTMDSTEIECIEGYLAAKYNLDLHDSCDALDIDSFLDHCSSLWDTRDDEVGTLSDDVDILRTDIATNTDSIATLTTSVTDNDDDIAALTTHVDDIEVALSSRVTDVESQLLDLANPVFPAQQVSVGALDHFGDELGGNVFVFLLLIANVVLLTFGCYVMLKLNKNVKYEKVRSFGDSDTDHQPLKR